MWLFVFELHQKNKIDFACEHFFLFIPIGNYFEKYWEISIFTLRVPTKSNFIPNTTPKAEN